MGYNWLISQASILANGKVINSDYILPVKGGLETDTNMYKNAYIGIILIINGTLLRMYVCTAKW